MANVAGIDWASEEHAVCVVDEAGTPLRERVVAHDEAGIAALCRKLIELQVERVAIERPDGIVVDRLLDAGLIVIAVHPNQAKAARERYSVAHGKSDRFDAFVLAELARTDVHRLRAIRPDSDQTRALRALSRTREDLVQARVALANQLRAQLEAFWPGALVFAHVDSPVSLAFLRRYPSPADAKGLRTKRLAGWLARHGYSGRRSPEELLARMRSAPEGRAGELEVEARRAAVLGLVAALEPIVAQIRATRFAPSVGPGCVFSGAVGRTACPMTPPFTAICAAFRRRGVDTGRLTPTPEPAGYCAGHVEARFGCSADQRPGRSRRV